MDTSTEARAPAQAAHTAGPWTIKRTNLGMMVETVENESGYPVTVAQVYSPHLWGEHRTTVEHSDAVGETNARLIAAAPHMLDALRHALALLDTPAARRRYADEGVQGNAFYREVLSGIRLAIARAGVRTP